VTFRGLRPTKINLTGGQACDAAFVDMFSEQINMECCVGKPLRSIDTSGVDLGEDRRSFAADWAVCTGLALRTVDMSEFGREGDDEDNRLSA
jgi:Tfp pilus assembly PilM family ATPase